MDLLPKTIKQQREEAKATKGVSIKITKPRLTINGFVVENTAPSGKESTQAKSKKSLKSKESKNTNGSGKKDSALNQQLNNQRLVTQSIENEQQATEPDVKDMEEPDMHDGMQSGDDSQRLELQ